MKKVNSKSVWSVWVLLAMGLIVWSAGCSEDSGPAPQVSQDDRQAAAQVAQTDGVVNRVCPIMGAPVDPENVPANLKRQWNGQTIGFCCAGCPEKWDALSDAEKETKLKDAMAKASAPAAP